MTSLGGLIKKLYKLLNQFRHLKMWDGVDDLVHESVVTS